MTQTTGSTSFYRDRAVCRKVWREGTGLQPDRMSTRQLLNLIERHTATIRAAVEQIDGSNIALVRAAVELDDACVELVLRGVQLSFPGM